MSKRYPNLLVVQGETFNSFSFTLEGDYSDWNLRGQIRTELLEKGGTIVGIFQFHDSVYEAETGLTTVHPFLPESTTANLQIASDEGRYWYDIEVYKDGEVVKRAPGRVDVIGEVTDSSVIWDPPVVWSGSIDHISLTGESNLTKTYTVWGDESETLNLGSFSITDGTSISGMVYDEETGIVTQVLIFFL